MDTLNRLKATMQEQSQSQNECHPSNGRILKSYSILGPVQTVQTLRQKSGRT